MAFLLCISVFGFWCFVGLALLSWLDVGSNLLRRILIAPAAGAAATVLPVFTLNRMGLPVRNFAAALTVAMLAGVALLLWRTKPVIPARKLLPFVAVVLLALLITGYPLLLYGFNWVSYCNDDMTNYVLAAHNFADHGFDEVPDARSILENRETSRTLWFMYAIGGVRPGSDLTLAWLLSITRLTGFQVYMPMMIALHLSLISCLGGLVLRSRRFRIAALTSCAWLALSPLNTLGTMYQLVAQVFGLMLLTASATVLLQPFSPQSIRQRLRMAVLAGLLVAALAVVYTEITPFLLVAFGGFHALQLFRSKERVGPLLAAVAVIAAAAAILLRSWGVSAALFFLGQAGGALGARNLDLTIFPYYLMPSGLANLWGFAPIGRMPLDAAIVLGGVLLAIGLVFSVWQAWRGEPAAMMSAVMLAVAARLFAGNIDFGLFKLAMYIQPFLLGSVVLGWFQFSKRWTCGRD